MKLLILDDEEKIVGEMILSMSLLTDPVNRDKLINSITETVIRKKKTVPSMPAFKNV